MREVQLLLFLFSLSKRITDQDITKLHQSSATQIIYQHQFGKL